MDTPPPRPTIPRAAWAVLAVVTLLGLWLRATGIEFGKLHEYHPDEWRVHQVAVRLLRDRSARVEFWAYPPALANLISALPLPPEAVAAKLAGRWGNTLSSSLAITLVGLTGQALAGWRAGLSAALLLAASPLAVEQSRYGVADGPTAFGVALVGFVVATRRDPTRLPVATVLGATVGLAASFKYVGALAGLMVAARIMSAGGSLPRRGLSSLVAAFAAAVTFAAVNRQIFGEFGSFVQALRAEHAHYASGTTVGFATSSTLAASLGYLFDAGLGVGGGALLTLGLLGGVRDRRARPLVICALLWLLFLGTRRVFFARNLAHLLPLAAVVAGLGLAGLHGIVVRRLREGPAAELVVVVVVALSVAPPALATYRFARALQGPDTRDVAAAWIASRIPPAERLAVVPETYDHYLPPRSLHGRRIVMQRGYPDLAALRRAGLRYVLLSSGQVSRFLREPSPDPERAREYRAWRAMLDAGADRLLLEARPPAPGANRVGATVDAYHHPTIEVWRLRD